jgi:hypothetical protein
MEYLDREFGFNPEDNEGLDVPDETLEALGELPEIEEPLPSENEK